jgi:hypothetical protein
VRDFERGIARLDRHYLSGDPAETLDRLELAAPIRHQLHPNADPEKWARASDYRLAQRRFETRYCGEAAPAVGESADARQDDSI